MQQHRLEWIGCSYVFLRLAVCSNIESGSFIYSCLLDSLYTKVELCRAQLSECAQAPQVRDTICGLLFAPNQQLRGTGGGVALPLSL